MAEQCVFVPKLHLAMYTYSILWELMGMVIFHVPIRCGHVSLSGRGLFALRRYAPVLSQRSLELCSDFWDGDLARMEHAERVC